jgi:glutaredoxin 3
MASVSQEIAATLSAHKVVVYSKTYCPYCDKAKAAFKRVGVAPHVVELDERPDGGAFQSELGKMTGGTSVPRVFVGGKFIGGGDDTDAAERSGKLAKLCREAGAIA